MTLFTPTSTQNERVLARLRQSLGDWVPMPTLAMSSGAFAVHSRVSDLRKQGHRIEQKSERKSGSRANHSFYRLLA